MNGAIALRERIHSPHNAKVKLAASLVERKYRREHGLVLVEGERLIRQALDFGAAFRFFFVDPDRLSPEAKAVLASAGAEVFEVTPEILRRVSDTRSPQGVIGVASAMDEQAFAPEGAEWMVVVDGVQDPGNLGTIQRVGAAVGVDGIALTRGTVDPSHPRAIRASAGAYFRTPLLCGCDPAELRENLKAAGITTVVADAHGAWDAFEYPWDGRIALVIGSEARGSSPELGGDVRVRIPMPGGVESLNAAVSSGVLLYEAWRRRQVRHAP